MTYAEGFIISYPTCKAIIDDSLSINLSSLKFWWVLSLTKQAFLVELISY